MNKLITILAFLFFSCESADFFGVGEFDPETYDYYDHVAHGWNAIFEEAYEEAESYFNEALESDVDYKNSAYVGLGWMKTFSANAYFSSDACLSQGDSECFNLVTDLRLEAEAYFQLAEVDLELAISEYSQCSYVNCFEEFDKDLQVGNIYLDVLKFYLSENGYPGLLDVLDLNTLVENCEQFLVENTSYDIMTNKPTSFLSSFNFNYQNLTVLLAQLLLRQGDDCTADHYLRELDICGENILGSEICYDAGNLIDLTDDVCTCGDINESLILECIQNQGFGF